MARSLTAPEPPPSEAPSLADLDGLQRRAARARVTLDRLRHTPHSWSAMFAARLELVVSGIFLLRPARVLGLYLERRGPLMAAGLAYRLFFAIAALLVVGFATMGLVIAGNEPLQSVIIQAVDASVPGLLKTEDGDGLMTPNALLEQTRGFGVTIILSAGVMLFTSLAWVAGMRQAMRGIFALHPVRQNFLLLRVKDLGTLALLGVVMVLTTVLGVLANNTLGALLSLLNIGGVNRVLTQVAGFAIMVSLDTLVMIVLLHTASAIEMPRRILLQGAVLAGVGSTVLRTFSTELVAGVSNNPLLFPFAVILALFIWFFILSQVYLVATAWCAVGTADATGRTTRAGRVRAGTLRRTGLRGRSR